MNDRLKFYIDGAWVNPRVPRAIDVVNPATEEPIGQVSLGSDADVDRAVAAARSAFGTYSQTSKAERIALLEKLIDCYRARADDLAKTISMEMGAPMWLAHAAQAPLGLNQLALNLQVLKDYAFQQSLGATLIRREPIGVCGLITPWNWPTHQIMAKVAPALAAGCTVVLKPSEVTPLSGVIIAEIMHAAGVPAGVFNLINGDGPGVGEAIARHADIDMVSITGSKRAGAKVAEAAAASVKRVTQELGGKSPNVILDDADLEEAVSAGVQKCFGNSGQSCNAPSRMLVPEGRYAAVAGIAKKAAALLRPGDPASSEDAVMGPVATKAQYDKIQTLIQTGIDEGAELICGGKGKPEGFQTGYYVKPTIFGRVKNDMTIAREEIFGPVLSILSYSTEEDAIALANDSEYGLAGFVWSGSVERAFSVASQLRTGMVYINGAPPDFTAPFGGYKHSGNGRELGVAGLEEFLETKSVVGAMAPRGGEAS